MIAAVLITHNPQRLAALCELWQSTEREVSIKLQGVSMCPTILPGTRIRMRCHRRELTPGIIIAYRHHGFLIVHRLVQIVEGSEPGKRWVICRGDNTGAPDPPVPLDEVVGEIIDIGSPPVLTLAYWKLRKTGQFCKGTLRMIWKLANRRRALRS